jgi:hypothetical protein
MIGINLRDPDPEHPGVHNPDRQPGMAGILTCPQAISSRAPRHTRRHASKFCNLERVMRVVISLRLANRTFDDPRFGQNKTVSDKDPNPEGKKTAATWGPKLFYVALIASLIYFWWLVIYDHGVRPIHGG